VIDQTAAAERNIAVRAAPGANAAAVAEHTWALILACAKSWCLWTSGCDGHWDKATHKSIELEGLTLNWVGCYRLARGDYWSRFGMKVLGSLC
jgi:D-3-phosphoglycerate dehydrogenase